MHRLTLIPGDGIGPEITAAVTEIIKAAGVEIDLDVQTAGADVAEKDPEQLALLPETGEFRAVADRLSAVNHMLRLPGQPEPERLLVARMDIRMVAPVK